MKRFSRKTEIQLTNKDNTELVIPSGRYNAQGKKLVQIKFSFDQKSAQA